jgi:phage terminase large subunit GpA-like protein
VGFFINSLYSPLGWYSWGDIARDYEEAKREFEDEKKTEKLRTFTNTVLGKTYEEPGEAPEWKRLYLRREPYTIGTVPVGVAFLTCGVDIQKDRIELEVVGWGLKKESWSIEYQVLPGNTSEDAVWEALEEALGRTFPGEEGGNYSIRMTAIDSGFQTQSVYNFCRKFAPNRVVAVKGNDNLSVIVGLPRIVDAKLKGRIVHRRAAKVWNIGVSILKSELYGWLNMDPPVGEEKMPGGFCHFPEYDEEYFKQLTAEKVVTKRNRKGYTAQEWVKERERNEALDARIYARAAASLAGLDRMKEKDTDKVRKKELAQSATESQTSDNGEVKPRRRPRKKRQSDFW